MYQVVRLGQGSGFSFKGFPPSMNNLPLSVNAAAIFNKACCSSSGWRPSNAPTRTARARSNFCWFSGNSNVSIFAWRNRKVPLLISVWELRMACSMAFADRSMASTFPLPIRFAISRAATPVPQPISNTRRPCVKGRASTISKRRCEMIGAILLRLRVAPQGQWATPTERA